MGWYITRNKPQIVVSISLSENYVCGHARYFWNNYSSVCITGQQNVVCRLEIINTLKPEVTQLIFKIFYPHNKQSASLLQSSW
jgi:hypothetical protein